MPTLQQLGSFVLGPVVFCQECVLITVHVMALLPRLAHNLAYYS